MKKLCFVSLISQIPQGRKKVLFCFCFLYINFFHPTTHDYIKTQPPQVQFFVLFYFHYILPRRILKKLKEKNENIVCNNNRSVRTK